MIDFVLYHTPIYYLIQSIWRDEAFSYFMSKPNLLQIIINTAHDFNPPFYYLVLHFWISIFGKSDTALKILSLIPHLITVYIAYLFSKKLFNKKYAFCNAFFFLFNPMLIYYAFEIRMYSFYALFSLSSIFFFYSKNWKWYTIFTILGLYTHSFFPIIIVSLVIYLLLTKNFNKKNLFRVLFPIVFYLPWLPVLLIQFANSGNSWMFPVDIQLIKSVLGNLFINFEGTPGGGWNYTYLLSILISFYVLLGLKGKKNIFYLFIIPIILPLSLVLLFSILKRPIYVNRYLIFVSVSEIMAISFGIWSIKKKVFRVLSFSFWILLILFINIAISPYHQKTDFKKTFIEINKFAKENDLVFTKTPIAFLESAYYFKYDDKVFVYNPNNISIPNYIGVTVVFPNVSKPDFPPSPSRTFLVSDNGDYELFIKK